MHHRLLFLFLHLAFCLPAQPVRVAVAANAQFVTEALRTDFQQRSGIQLETIVSSSGKLTAQIQQGAPFDLFLSADMDYPRTLYEQQLTTTAPVTYAYGSLVLWTLGKWPLSPDLRVLKNPAIHHIAVANPALAPYGEAAVALLKHRQLFDTVKDRLVYGESISQVNQYVLTGSAEVGITAKAVVLDPGLKGRGHWIDLPPQGYAPIAQGVVILKRTTQLKTARQFLTYLRSRDARRILERYGYRAP